MRPGDEITVEATELVAGGAALAKVDGFPIFTSNMFPGDVAVVRLFEVKKGFARADLARLIEASPLRRLQPCPVANECGGCDWTALRLDAQLQAKKRILTESLRRIGKFDIASLPPITVHASPLNYRLRSRLQTDGEHVGFYASRSNDVVQLPKECEVVGIETARRPTPGQTWEIDGELVTDERELTISVSSVHSVVKSFSPQRTQRSQSFTYRLSTNSFFQVNRHLLATLLGLVTAHAARVEQRKLAVDLYAGVGFFTLPIAQLFDRVLAIEGSSESAHYGRMNVPSNVKFVAKAVERAEIPKADLIFLDPPRAGARPEVIAATGKNAREMICYLSCDPVTFSRDAHRLSASGWRLATLDLLDLFPNTHHVETLSSFERAR